MTGLNLAALYELLPSFERDYEANLDERDKERGGGRNGALPNLEDKPLFILSQIVQSYVFGMGQTQAGEWIRRLAPILNRALGYEKQLPAHKPQDIAQVLKMCPGLAFIIDEIERPILRPKNKEKQKEYYSSKKGRHTVKSNVISEKPTKKVKALSATCEGKKHDKKLADEQAVPFPKGSKLWKDTGF